MLAGVLKENRALRRRRSDFEAPASVRIAGVRRSPIEPEELRLSIREGPGGGTPFLSPFRRWRSASFDIPYARLVNRTLHSRQHHVVRIPDGLEDVHAADT